VLHRFAAGGRAPDAAVKVVLRSPVGDARPVDADRLAQLGRAAAEAGARVPRAAVAHTRGGYAAVFETRVPGRPASMLVAESPERSHELVERIAAWLDRWGRGTAHALPVDPAWLEREVLGPSVELAPHLAASGAYHAWLAALGGSLVGAPLPRVAVHGDLTTANVLVDADGTIGVVDWEAARAGGMPLTDLFYAVADVASASRRHADRVGAFVACFGGGGGTLAPAASRLAARLAAGLALPDGAVTLAFHACWLGHAANEVRVAAPGVAGPFLEIARWLAARHTTWRLPREA
jgi:hypothetical protein